MGGEGLVGRALRGAIAGAVATWVMDRVTGQLYRTESRAAFLREKRAQRRGLYPADRLADGVARRFGRRLSRREARRWGHATHYALGILPGVLYGLFRARAPWLARGRGLLYGFALFALEDELANPLLGTSAGPLAYPLQAHARGLVGHLVLGAITDVVIDVLGGQRGRGRRDEAPAALLPAASPRAGAVALVDVP
jgi:uncharacterized membrane protein YeaQ/YmgE (transglycosylase-associated protein family)